MIRHIVQIGSERRTGRGDRRQRRIEASGLGNGTAVIYGRTPYGPGGRCKSSGLWGRRRGDGRVARHVVTRAQSHAAECHRDNAPRARGNVAPLAHTAIVRVERVRMTPHRSIGEMNFAKNAYGCRFCSTCSRSFVAKISDSPLKGLVRARCARSYTERRLDRTHREARPVSACARRGVATPSGGARLRSSHDTPQAAPVPVPAPPNTLPLRALSPRRLPLAPCFRRHSRLLAGRSDVMNDQAAAPPKASPSPPPALRAGLVSCLRQSRHCSRPIGTFETRD